LGEPQRLGAGAGGGVQMGDQGRLGGYPAPPAF